MLDQLRGGQVGRAWAAIEEHYGPMMVATANAKLGFAVIDAGSSAIGARSANDVVQQVFVELIAKGPGLADTIEGSLGAYLLGAVRNRVRTAFEKRRDVALEDPDVIEQRGDAPDFAEAVVDDQMVDAALGPLDSRDRLIVVETVMRMRSNADVGRDLNLTGQQIGKIRKKVVSEVASRLGDISG